MKKKFFSVFVSALLLLMSFSSLSVSADTVAYTDITNALILADDALSVDESMSGYGNAYTMIYPNSAGDQLYIYYFNDFAVTDNSSTLNFEISAARGYRYDLTSESLVSSSSSGMYGSKTLVYNLTSGETNGDLYYTDCPFEYNGENYASFFTSAPIIIPTPTTAPTLVLEELTPTAMITLGKTKVMEVVKTILIMVFGVLCLILLAPLVRKLLLWLKGLVNRS